ncbi:MAG: MBL fold metallo-hydrolase [Anaerolineae bacterium]|nr:MBL fold metallo-hydrolase [Anaerolineae bacterium]MDH7475590.1 MBL fold metallo-hydrolase [Anaerolineae bacterium]
MKTPSPAEGPVASSLPPMMKIRFWGVRGGVPVPGPDTVRVGGNTPCVEVRTPDGDLIILDAGSGIRLLGLALQREFPERLICAILISHTHLDHIQGFPFFAPARQRHNRIAIFGEKRFDEHLEQILAGQMRAVYLPFALDDMDADILIKEMRDGETLVIGNNTLVDVRRLEHPGGVFGFRITHGSAVLTYATDVGHGPSGLDQRVVDLARSADLLIHDAQFSSEQKAKYWDWGHSSWEDAVHVALAAGVKRLALFHHDMLADDDQLEEVERQAQALFPGAFIAYEGLEIVLPVRE